MPFILFPAPIRIKPGKGIDESGGMKNGGNQ